MRTPNAAEDVQDAAAAAVPPTAGIGQSPEGAAHLAATPAAVEMGGAPHVQLLDR